VPLPRTGRKPSRQRSYSPRSISRGAFSLFCVGWSVFSGIDQNGTVISVQRFDGAFRENSLNRFGPVLRISIGVAVGRQDASANFDCIELNVYWFETVQNQISSLEFFQLVFAPRPFSRSHVIRLRTIRPSSHAAMKIDCDDNQSPQMYTVAFGFSNGQNRCKTSRSHSEYWITVVRENLSPLKSLSRLYGWVQE